MPSPIPVENHEHMFTGAWEYDENGHWQLCACGEKSDIEAHDMQWTLVRAAKKDQPWARSAEPPASPLYPAAARIEYTGQGIQLTEGMFKYIIIGIVAMIVILVVVKLISDAGRRNRRGHHGGYRGRH